MALKLNVFGSDIDPYVKQKLALRQELARTANFGEAIQGASDNLVDVVDMYSSEYNFPQGGETGQILADLSSRTPFARIWTAIEATKAEPIYNWEHEEDPNPNWDLEEDEIYNKETKTIDKVSTLETKIYSIGNHDTTQVVSPNDTVEQKANEKIFYNEFEKNNNEFLRPPAGITSISQRTEGTSIVKHIPLYLNTTVNFIVYNLTDFDEIYSKYFLNIGARVFIDFGWDTAHLYDPNTIIFDDGKAKQMSKNDIFDRIFGKDGPVKKSAGDLQTTVGRVIDAKTNIREDGSFECTLELLSENFALMSEDIGVDRNIRRNIVDEIDRVVLVEATKTFDKNFLNSMLYKDIKQPSLSKEYFYRWASLYLYKYQESNNPNVPKGDNKEVFWVGARYESISDMPETADMADPKNIFVSWKFFEREILNDYLGVTGFDKNTESGIDWDSSISEIEFNKNLYARQQTTKHISGDLRFLYSLQSEYESEEEDWEADKILDKCSIYSIFIQVSLIKNAFQKSNTTKEAVEIILNEINKNSEYVYNLTIFSPDSPKQQKLSVIDSEAVINDTTAEDEFKNTFLFKPHSPNTIVKGYTINIGLPSGRLKDAIFAQSNFGRSTKLKSNSGIDSLYVTKEIEKRYSIEGLEKGDNINYNYLPNVKVKSPTPEANEDKHYKLTDSTATGEEAFYGVLDLKQTSKKDTYNNKLSEELYNLVGNKDTTATKGDDSPENKLKAKQIKYDRELKQERENDPNPDKEHFSKDEFDYWSNKAKEKHDKRSQAANILFAEVQLTMYGISGLLPGNKFRVDYLPRKYRDKVYFLITEISHEVTTSGWTTSIKGLMQVLPGLVEEIVDKLFLDQNFYIKKSYFTDSLGLQNFGSYLSKMKNIESFRTNVHLFPELDYQFSFIATKKTDITLKWTMPSFDFDADPFASNEALNRYYENKVMQISKEYNMGTGKEEYITKRKITLEKDKKYYFVIKDQYWDIIEYNDLDEISDIKKYLGEIEKQRLDKKALEEKPLGPVSVK